MQSTTERWGSPSWSLLLSLGLGVIQEREQVNWELLPSYIHMVKSLSHLFMKTVDHSLTIKTKQSTMFAVSGGNSLLWSSLRHNPEG